MDMNLYFMELRMMLDSAWRYRDKDGCRLRREELKMDELDENWEGMQEVNKPKLVIVVT